MWHWKGDCSSPSLYGKEPIWRIPKACQWNEEMALQSECLQAPHCLPNRRNPLGELQCGYRIQKAETGTEKSLVSDSFRTTWASIWDTACCTVSCGTSIPRLTHISLSSLDFHGERYGYWFLKTNIFMEWGWLKENHTRKWRMPQSDAFRTARRGKNLFFITDKNVFLDGRQT